jgi:CubicO group peptidase (beta-lactamase class C family)
MSYPVSNVYFYNPQVENNVSNINEVLNDLGYGQTLSNSVASNVMSTLMNYAYGETIFDAKHKGAFVYGGNFKSGQSFFASTGICNSKGEAWTLDTKYNWGSTAKVLTGLTCAKMIEEGLITDKTRLVEYAPSIFTGSAQYYSSIILVTGAEALFPFNPPAAPVPSYIATTGSYDLTNLDIEDLLRMNLGVETDFFIFPASPIIAPLTTYSTGATSLVGNLGRNASTSDYAGTITSSILFQSLALQGTSAIGSFSPYFNGLAIDPSTLAENVIIKAFNNARNGTLPLLYKPEEAQVPLLPYNARDLPASYDFSYLCLGYILDKVVRANGYTNLSAYINTKFFIPLGMSNSHLILQDTFSSTNLSELSWRRSVVLGAVPFNTNGTGVPFNIATGTTWPSYGCSPSYAALAATTLPFGDVAGPLVWTSEYPDDGISLSSRFILYQTGSPTNYTLANTPLVASIRDFGKLIQFIGNRGVAPTGTPAAGQRLIKTETWNYLVAVKISSFSSLNAFSSLINATNFDALNGGYGMGLIVSNRDIQASTEYAFTDTTLYNGGATGNIYIVDPYTGNWLIMGVPEIFTSTGVIDWPSQLFTGTPILPNMIGRSPQGKNYVSDLLVKMIQ